jgi:hypothetical protein
MDLTTTIMGRKYLPLLMYECESWLVSGVLVLSGGLGEFHQSQHG